MLNKDELFKINLQLFGGDDLDGVENDDGNDEVDNDGDLGGNEDVELEDLLKELNAGDDETDEEDALEAQEGEEGKEEKHTMSEEEVDALVNDRVVAEVNRIIQGRLARDRKTQQVTHLEKLTGMSLEQVTQTVVENMVEAKAEELGISEQEARAIVERDIELTAIKTEREQENMQKQDESAIMQQVKYLQDKSAHMQKPKLARILKDCEAEIDAFTKNGSILSFEDGMKYVLGQKLASGELMDKVQAGAEQKTLRNIERRGKAAPQNKNTGGNAAKVTLSKEERIIAANLGVSEKDYAVEKLNESNKRKGKSR